jgi:hypothetical protein
VEENRFDLKLNEEIQNSITFHEIVLLHMRCELNSFIITAGEKKNTFFIMLKVKVKSSLCPV